MKPEWCRQDVWGVATNEAAQYVEWLEPKPEEYAQSEHVLAVSFARAILEAEQRKQAEIDRLNAVIGRMQQTMSSQAEQWTRSMSEAEQRGRREGMEESAEMIESIGFSANFIRAKIDEVQK